MKVLIAQHNADATSGLRLGMDYIVGEGIDFASLVWGSVQTFPCAANPGPYGLCFEPVSKTFLLWGPQDMSGDPRPGLWRSTDGATWTGPANMDTLLGVSSYEKARPAICESPMGVDGLGNVLVLLDEANNTGSGDGLCWSRSTNAGLIWSAVQVWTATDNEFALHGPVFENSRWAVLGSLCVSISDNDDPTDFAPTLTGDVFFDGDFSSFSLGWCGTAWIIPSRAAFGTTKWTAKRNTDSLLASGSWLSPEHLVSSGHSLDVYEGTRTGGGTTPFFPHTGGFKRLAREGGGVRNWIYRVNSSLLYSDAEDGTGWQKALADHTAGSSAGMHPFLDYRRSNFTSGDVDLIADIVQDTVNPGNLDHLLSVGRTYSTNTGVTYRNGVISRSEDGGDTWEALVQLPVASGEWGLAFVWQQASTPGAPATPAPDKPARASRDTVIFDFLAASSLRGMRTVRAGQAWAFRRQMFERALYNQPLLEAPFFGTARARLPALLVEPLLADGQQLLQPFDFSKVDPYELGEWNHDDGITIAPTRPIMRGMQTTRVTNDGTSDWNGIWQDLAVNYTGEPETWVGVLRRGSHDLCELWVWDPGVSDDIAEISFNLRDGTHTVLYGEPSVRMIRIPTLGGDSPAWLVFVTFTGTLGEVPEFGWMPTGRREIAGYTDVAYIGWLRGARGVNPLSVGDVTGGLAYFENVPALGGSSWAGRLQLGQPSTIAEGFFWQRGQLDLSAPYLALRCDSPGVIYAEHDNGSDPAVQCPVSGLSWREGDDLDYLLTLLPGGGVHLALSLRGEIPVQGIASEDVAIAGSAYDDALILSRGNASQARCHHQRLVALHSSHLSGVPGASSPTILLDDGRQYRVRGNALGDPI